MSKQLLRHEEPLLPVILPCLAVSASASILGSLGLARLKVRAAHTHTGKENKARITP